MTVPLIRAPEDHCVFCGESIHLQGMWRHLSTLLSACENGRTNAQPPDGSRWGASGLDGSDAITQPRPAAPTDDAVTAALDAVWCAAVDASTSPDFDGDDVAREQYRIRAIAQARKRLGL